MATDKPPVYETLGASGLRVPRLWLGAMMFGDQTDEAVAREMVAVTRDAGLNAIDTADNYAGGESEKMVGKLIAKDRSRWVVATKVANPIGNEPNDRGTSRHWVMREVDNSLSRLATDYIDVYYMHRDDESVPIEEVLSTFARLIELGKIRYYGVSNFRGWRVARMVETARRMGVPQPIVCQPPYSAVTRLIETELIPSCNHYGVGVVAYSPLARGVLTGKYQPDVAPDANSRAGRGDRRMHQTEFRPESMNVANELKAYAQSRGLSPTQFAIAWALNNRCISGVIGGPRTLDQWQDYVLSLNVQLTAEDEALVDRLVPQGYASTHGFVDPQYPIQGRKPRN
ncbi:aldo/keto reductase [Orrella sp. NBD-18]|uniref:Aldo/keto reductase n=1 Tax=Sheuella amnicola TaxID=2707330 RepID=A0A6B2QZQ4_9BURK|nr:aldo/keto reductase [Sheuella amnicola]NDY83980.1 aldo/keto reductase [Sheuella amnicola]HBI82926.1 NADP-dependent oxidoreductase [Alcaligenaceae bacterium]